MNIIDLSQQEFESNVAFSLNLVEKGHTLKLTTNNGIVCIVSPVASVTREEPKDENPVVPLPEEFTPDPVGTRQYVGEALQQMTNMHGNPI